MMNKKLLLTGALILGLAGPVHAGSSRDEAALGSLIGGVVGAVIGNSYNGQQGAAVGAVIGATAGAYIAVDDDDHKRRYRPDRSYRGHGHGRHHDAHRYRKPQHTRYRQPYQQVRYNRHDHGYRGHRHDRYCRDD